MPNINTLNTVKRAGDEDSSDDDDRQGFFVGGSDRSGQQVLGPHQGGAGGPPRGNDVVEQIYAAARRAGAEVLNSEETAQEHDQFNSGGSTTAGRTFGGSGRPIAPGSSNAPTNPERVHVQVIFWQDGFSIDDGPLRAYEAPGSAEFIRAMGSARIPPELQQKYGAVGCDVHLLRRDDEPYKKPPTMPFRSSNAQRVGAIVPTIVSSASSDHQMPSAKLGADDATKLLESAQKEVNVDTAKPSGKIQIRQPNGHRIVGQFNESHTVEDVRTFVVSALPDYAAMPFRLRTVYPNKTIEEENQTVVAAGILNAVVVIQMGE